MAVPTNPDTELKMPDIAHTVRTGCAAALVASALVLGGCGLSGTDVELNGGLFDVLGVSASSSKQGAEPKLAPRAGLVLPPQGDRLPAPGEHSGPTAEAWPDDPDQRKVRNAAVLDRQQAEFCQKQALEAKINPGAILPDGPKGSCNPSVLGAFGWSGSQK